MKGLASNSVMIFDVNGLLNWMYYGYLNAIEEDKKSASDAVYQFIVKLVQMENPKYVFGVMDLSRDTTWRRKLYPEYKAQRNPTPEELKQEKNKIYKILKSNNIPVFLSPDYEADDFAGTLTKMYEPVSDKVILITKDQDYLQLVSEKTVVWLGKKDEETVDTLATKYGSVNKITSKIFQYTPEVVRGEYGIEPIQIRDLKGFNGDSSDNIPGCKYLGKTAIPLLNKYGTMENVYFVMDHTPEDTLFKFWNKELKMTAKKFEHLKDERDTALLSKKLATIVTDVPIK